MYSAGYYWHILMKLEFFSTVFGEFLKCQIHENPSNGSQVVASGRTDVQTYMTKLRVGCRHFTNAPKIDLIHT